jgi:nucleoid-associated protein YgaU
MASQSVLIGAGASTAALVVAGAAALYWSPPSFLRPALPPPASAQSSPSPAPSPTPSPAPVVAAAETAPKAAAAPAPPKPAFDVVNVEPTGESVIAGRAAPNAKVELRDSGKVVAEATTDASGQFVMIPPTLAPGEHSLMLAAPASGGLTSNAVAVSVAEPAVKSPAPPPVASAPIASASISTGEAGSRVAVKSVEASPGGRLVATGAAAPNATVRLYLSGAYIGDATTNADGRWSMTIAHGMTQGAYKVRADEIDPANAAVVARAEAPFAYPAASADTPAPAAAPVVAIAAGSRADLVIDSVQTHHVEPGHTLWGISQRFYGDGSRYELIFAANSDQIKNPNLIYPGQMFVVPKRDPKP